MEGVRVVPPPFNVGKDPYGEFITRLSKELAEHPDHPTDIEKYGNLVRDHPLLPKQEGGRPGRWMEITLWTMDEKMKTTLAVRGDNVYLLGFKNKDDNWYEFGKETAPKKNRKLNATHFLTRSTFLGFNSRYEELLGQSGWTNQKLGMISANEAVFELSKYNGKDTRKTKLYLARLIVMICESARMFSYRNIVGSGWGGTDIHLTDPNLIGYLNNWENMSQVIMGWAEYTDGLKKIGIEGHKQACEVVHLILNSPTGKTVLAKGNKSEGGDDPGKGHPGDGNDHSSKHGDEEGNGHSSQQGGSDGQSPRQGGNDGQSSHQGRSNGHPPPTDGNGNRQHHVDHSQSLVEVFTLGTANSNIPFLGSITIFDGRLGQIIFWNEEEGSADTKEGNFVLIGPYRGISADGRVALKIIPAADDEAEADVSIWDPYTEDEHQYDKILTENILGDLTLTYAVLSSAVEASVQVDVFLFEKINFYGKITAHSILARGEEATVVLLSSGAEDEVELVASSAGSRIPLTRSVVAWPVCSSIDINVDCCFQAVTTPTDEGTSSSASASATTPLTFTFDHHTAKVCFRTLEGLGYVRVSVDDTREYRDEPNNSLPRSLTNEVIKMNPDMSIKTGLLVVHPSQLTFTFQQNKLMHCLLHLTNKSDNQHVAFRCSPDQKSASYYHRIWETSGILPPDSTSTYIVGLKSQLPPNIDALSLILQSRITLEEDEEDVDKIFDTGTNDGIVEETLKATVYGPVVELTSTSEFT